MSATDKNRWTPEQCFTAFEADVGSNKYTEFRRESILARSFMEDNFTMQDIGFVEDGKPWVNKNSIRKTVNQAYSRIILKERKVIAAPYEGFNVEQDLSKICEFVWKFEDTEPRTSEELMLDEEKKFAGRDSLIEGCGYVDSRIDDTIGSSLFPNGKAVYERIRPLRVVIDKAAESWNKKRHVHIIHWITPDNFEVMFDQKAELIRSTDDEYSDPEKTGGLIRVIETQYKTSEITQLYKLTEDQMIELGVENPYIWKEDIIEILEVLRVVSPTHEFLDIKVYLRNTEKVRRSERTGWFSVFHLQGKECHKKPFYQGATSTLKQLCPFPADNSPYGHGMPFFLLPTAIIEMILGTQAIRSILSRRAYMAGKPSKEFLDKWNENKLTEIFAVEGDMINPDLPVRDQIDFEDNTQKAPFLFNAWQQMQGESADEYGDQSSTLPADASRFRISHVQELVADMLNMIVDAVKGFNEKIYGRSLKLALATIPQPMLYILAGENDEERMKLIMTGEIYERLETMNAHVEIDERSEEMKLLQTQIVGEMLKNSAAQLPVPIGKAGEMIGLPESYELEKIAKQEFERLNPQMVMAKRLAEDPVVAAILENYDKQKQQQQASKQIAQ